METRDKTRAKYIAVITMSRTAAALGEAPAMSAITKMCGVSNAFPTRMRAAGLMTEEGGKLIFTPAAAKMTPDELVDNSSASTFSRTIAVSQPRGRHHEKEELNEQTAGACRGWL